MPACDATLFDPPPPLATVTVRSPTPGVSVDNVAMLIDTLGKVFRGQFLIVEGSHGILGRNVINSVSLIMDGPQLIWRKTK